MKIIYSFSITDLQGECVGCSWNISITFTVKKIDNEWYIIDKYETA